MTAKNQLTIQEMRDKIEKLTGRIPVSTDQTYLRNRLSLLQRLAPEDLPKARARERSRRIKEGEGAVPLSVSVSENQRDLVLWMSAKLGVSASQVVRDAIERYGAQVSRR